ncbi:MAG TPA: sigma-70 family RNA polymerase sigma factor [Blastocatellia bacterium]|nr:sigma-70 family RNA polymerase sigma factor [Blastocatellia bacterium]
MKRDKELTQEAFDKLLEWFNPDRDLAGKKYEEIRYRLIRILSKRGCNNPETLADEAINRVIVKVEEISSNYVGDPAVYFYGVANKVFLESTRSAAEVQVGDINLESFSARIPDADEGERKEAYFNCLESCLNELPDKDRQIILKYYMQDKQARITGRKQLAEQIGATAQALRMRARRIRASLLTCMQKCMGRIRI